MDDRFEMSLLLDFYGVLLTEKQFDLMKLYYDEDLSLGEIAEINSTSRQATFDTIKRCHKLLYSYEEKLMLLKKSEEEKIFKKVLIEKLQLINTLTDDDRIKTEIDNLKEYVTSTTM
ncbi:helix-turn-helix protein YlxM/p13 family protein [Clostridium cellulovorans 743B]|uniref:UPF0122 protein Clocel_1901 n=2 Tax=Clostridium cellulovorans TaxID=1493 RepID=D9SLC9_CLOC7|nr:putative DNA-binding protein [Clostridium cellulovorans]ADL51645.1 helix-turn-helix protein YlxM/p13 family protein [Clostridium cellulovorans 743B]